MERDFITLCRVILTIIEKTASVYRYSTINATLVSVSRSLSLRLSDMKRECVRFYDFTKKEFRVLSIVFTLDKQLVLSTYRRRTRRYSNNNDEKRRIYTDFMTSTTVKVFHYKVIAVWWWRERSWSVCTKEFFISGKMRLRTGVRVKDGHGVSERERTKELKQLFSTRGR